MSLTNCSLWLYYIAFVSLLRLTEWIHLQNPTREMKIRYWKLGWIWTFCVTLNAFLSPMLRKGDIGLPFARQSICPAVLPFALNNFKSKTLWFRLVVRHISVSAGNMENQCYFYEKSPPKWATWLSITAHILPTKPNMFTFLAEKCEAFIKRFDILLGDMKFNWNGWSHRKCVHEMPTNGIALMLWFRECQEGGISILALTFFTQCGKLTCGND